MIGYLAQTTGLCLVRGVSDWVSGRRARLLAILLAGFWVYLFLPMTGLSGAENHLQRYAMHWGFLLGGVIFGLGTAANGACSISTATRLSSGDLRMLFTILGWTLGWQILAYSDVSFAYQELPVSNVSSVAFYVAILLALTLATLYVYFKRRSEWPVWSGIMLVGVLAGGVFWVQPAWSPSDFVRDFGEAMIMGDLSLLPTADRIGILGMMLFGMGIAAWRYRSFHVVLPGLRDISKHFSAGILMGIGASFALGGNDFQLLLAAPALSSAGILAILGILLGIRLGLRLVR